MNLLHSADTLVHIAEATGPAADWARVLLAFVAPDRNVGLPLQHAAITPWLVVRPDSIEDLVPALDLHRESAAVALLEALELGLCPEDPGTLAGELGQALVGDGDVADLHIAAALGRMGFADPRVLAAAANSQCADRDWLLPPLVMRVAEQVQQGEAAAAEVAEGLLRSERKRPGAIALCLAELGIPSRSSWESPEHSARDAAAVLGVDTPSLARRQGSQRRHAQRVIRDLLDGRTDAGSTLVAALASRDDALATRLVYSATWLALYSPGDAVADVLHRHGGLDTRRLSDARRAVSPEHQPLLRGALDHGLEKAAILAHHIEGHPLATEVIDYLVRHDIAHRIDLFLGVHAAWQHPQRVPDLLQQPPTMALGLMLATWLPTLEVLEALLAWAPPEGDMWTQAYANALASMGDPAVLPRLRSLVEEHPEATAEARRLVEHILHQPLL